MITPGSVLLERYEVVRLIAHGGMADVFLAHDRRLARDVAVKAFRIGAADVRRFDAETRLLAGLSHPNLVSVFDAGEDGGQPYVVLRYVEGPTLDTRLTEGRLSIDDARRVCADLASALAYVHGRRVVHRDVKPSNILFAGDGRVLLGDFGIALLLDATRLTTEATTIGTAAYLAPEQITGDAVTEKADIYALGLVFLEAVSGTVAFAGSFQEVLTAKLARDPRLPPDLGEPWHGLLAAMTTRDPSARPSADEVGEILRTGRVRAATLPAPLPSGDSATVAANASPTLVIPASERTSTTVQLRRAPPRSIVLGALALLAVATLIAVLAARGDDGAGRVPLMPTTPSTAASTTPTAGRQAACAELERQKDEIEREKQAAERTYRDDKDTLEAIKQQLEDAKRETEEQKKAAGC